VKKFLIPIIFSLLIILVSQSLVFAVSPTRVIAKPKISPSPSLLPTLPVTPTPEPKSNPEVKLPYPGILPGHPFYFLKHFKEKLVISLVRNPFDRSLVLLFYAKKQLATARDLGKLQKIDRVDGVLAQARDYFKESLGLEVKSREELSRVRLEQLSFMENYKNVVLTFPDPTVVANRKFLKDNEESKARILKEIFQPGK
jgi:hypothetical protein